MRETTNVTEGMILRKLKKIRDSNTHNLSDLISGSIFDRIKTRRPKIRPGLVRLGYEICGGQDWQQRIVPACAAVEILNVSTYTINKIFDEKGGLWTKNKINNNIIAGILQRELTAKLIDYIKYVTDYKTFARIQKIFSQINTIIHVGQYLDLNILQIGNSFNNFEAYSKIYQKRCYCFGGKFYENALIVGALLAKAKEDQLTALKRFGKLFGMSLQIVNDIGDFVPPDKKPYKEAFKYYQDQYGDLRQGKLTLPIYLILKNSSAKNRGFILSMVGKKMTNLEDGYWLTKILVKSGAFSQIKKITNKYVRLAKKHLETFQPSMTRGLLSTTTSNVKSSIYWKAIKSIF